MIPHNFSYKKTSSKKHDLLHLDVLSGGGLWNGREAKGNPAKDSTHTPTPLYFLRFSREECPSDARPTPGIRFWEMHNWFIVHTIAS